MANNIVSTDKKTSKKNDKLLHRTITVCVVLLLVLCAGLFIWKKSGKISDNRLEDSVAAQLGQLDGKSEAEIQEELNRVVEDGTMAISINVNPVFKTGDSEGTLEIENVPNNKYAQVVSITLDDGGAEIYNSVLSSPTTTFRPISCPSRSKQAPMTVLRLSRLMTLLIARIRLRLVLLPPRLLFPF